MTRFVFVVGWLGFVAAQCSDLQELECKKNISCFYYEYPDTVGYCQGFGETSCKNIPSSCMWVDSLNPYTCADGCTDNNMKPVTINRWACLDRAPCQWETKDACVGSKAGCYWVAGTQTVCGKSTSLVVPNTRGFCRPCTDPGRKAFSKHMADTCTWAAGGNFVKSVSIRLSDYSQGSACPAANEDDLEGLTVLYSAFLRGQLNGTAACVPSPTPAASPTGWGASDILPAVLTPLILLLIGLGVWYYRRTHQKQVAAEEPTAYQPPQQVA